MLANSANLTIIWSNIIVDSIIFNEKQDIKATILNGKIYFKNKNHSAFYFMLLDNVGLCDGFFFFKTIYSPTIDHGTKNRWLTKEIKEEYISLLTKLTNSDRASAEGQYNRESELSDGVEKIKYKISVLKNALSKKK